MSAVLRSHCTVYVAYNRILTGIQAVFKRFTQSSVYSMNGAVINPGKGTLAPRRPKLKQNTTSDVINPGIAKLKITKFLPNRLFLNTVLYESGFIHLEREKVIARIQHFARQITSFLSLR